MFCATRIVWWVCAQPHYSSVSVHPARSNDDTLFELMIFWSFHVRHQLFQFFSVSRMIFAFNKFVWQSLAFPCKRQENITIVSGSNTIGSIMGCFHYDSKSGLIYGLVTVFSTGFCSYPVLDWQVLCIMHSVENEESDGECLFGFPAYAIGSYPIKCIGFSHRQNLSFSILMPN